MPGQQDIDADSSVRNASSSPRGSCKRSRMVNLGGTQKVDFLGTCCGGDGSELLGNDIFYGEKGSASRGSCKR